MSDSLQKEQIILGIDPGTNVMGYGVLQIKGQQMILLSMGIIDMSKLENHQLKLKKIFERVTWLVKEYLPDECAIEAPFFGKNVQSMLKLGRAQGVAMAAVLNRGVPIEEYSPRKIKQSITGNGNASKEQVSALLQKLVKFEQSPKFLDATDALAAAVCHHFQFKGVGSKSKGKNKASWKAFLAENPQRLKK
ncbi:MAG: crossover junction endodeoxyribonuclease RuvC [Chitinophagales bacterium]